MYKELLCLACVKVIDGCWEGGEAPWGGGMNNELLTRQAVTHCSPFVGVGERGRRLHSGTSHV